MSYLNTIPGEIALFVAIFSGFIALSVYLSVVRMTKAPDVIPAPELASEMVPRLPPEIAAFLQREGFGSPGFYRFHQVILGLWTREGGPPVHRFCFAQTPTMTTVDFVAEISERAELTTTRTRAAFMFPRQFGDFMQSFPNASLDQLWKFHLEGTEFLISHSIVPLGVKRREPFPTKFRRAITEQLAHVRSLPLWPVRGVYWYLVKRLLLRNQPIGKQNITKLYWRASELQATQ